MKFTFEEWALIWYNMEIAVMEHERNMRRCAVSDKPHSPYQVAKGEMEKFRPVRLKSVISLLKRNAPER